MTDHRCDREDEVLAALGAGRSTTTLGEELRDHLSRCAACRDLLAVAGALLDDRREQMLHAPIPSSGLVWWRATIRRRQESVRMAMRTAQLIQVALLLAGITAAVALVGGSAIARDLGALLSSLGQESIHVTMPLVAFAAWLVLAPAALYLVFTEE